MTWTQSDRQTFADLLPRHDEAPEEVMAFLEARRSVLTAEVGADPGVDQVRAGILRALREAGDADLEVCIAAALPVLRAFPEQVKAASPALLQRRHPSWVGLAALEAGLSIADAAELAAAGFRAFTGPQGIGDVLWAMAEAADDVSWSLRHSELLAAAVRADFVDRSQHDQVRLLWALDRLEHGDDVARSDAEAELVSLADDVEADERTRIHGLWVLAARRRLAADEATARRYLLAALALVDEAEEPDTAERIRQALGAPGPS